MSFQISKPTVKQLKFDAFLVVTAFLGAALASWQLQPNPFSKAALIAAGAAGLAAVGTLLKSILTTL